ncbi:MAG TPA: diacylglycerol kinase family protein [Chondromyces sp.]|nr:diacylglycerol kinase family protein [Chondromyces sp.]
MDSKDRGRRAFHLKRLIASFSFAWNGLRLGWKEPNFRIHIAAAVAVIAVGCFFSVSVVEWMILLFLIGGTLALELVNTAIEKTVDLVTPEYHPLAKQAKDLAAGAVLLFAIISVIMGLIIFLPKIYVYIR